MQVLFIPLASKSEMPTRTTRSHQTAILILLLALGSSSGQLDLAASAQESTADPAVSQPATVKDTSAVPQLDSNIDQLQKLSFAEKLYFGRVNGGLAMDDRLTHLEQALFGRSRSGSFEKRFARVDDALGIANRMRDEKLAASAVTAGASKASESESNVNKSKLPDLTVQPSQPASTATSDESGEATAANKSAAIKLGQPMVPQLAKPMEPKLASVPLEKQASETATRPNGGNAIVSADGDAVHTLLKQGMTAHLSGNNSVAQDKFKRVLAIAPRNADAFYNLGAIAETQGDLISALTHYRAALGINPLDRQLQEAVRSVEEQVAARQPTTNGGTIGGAANRNTANNKAQTPTNSSAANRNSVSTARNSSAPKSGASSAVAAKSVSTQSYSPVYTPGYTPASTADVSQQQPDMGDVSQSDPPVLNASQYPTQAPANPKAFSLQTSQYGANLVNQPPTYGVYQQPPPIYDVSQNPPPVVPVSHGTPPTHGLLGAFLSVGGGAALGPLHCPICRLSHMGW